MPRLHWIGRENRSPIRGFGGWALPVLQWDWHGLGRTRREDGGLNGPHRQLRRGMPELRQNRSVP